MKVIDLLNKMANDKNYRPTVKFLAATYKYNEKMEDYESDINSDWGIFSDYTINNILNDTVKLIEDETIDIDNINLDKIIKVFEDIEMCLDRLSVKISSAGQGSIDNYLDRYKYDLQAVKQLNKEIKSIKEK